MGYTNENPPELFSAISKLINCPGVHPASVELTTFAVRGVDSLNTVTVPVVTEGQENVGVVLKLVVTTVAALAVPPAPLAPVAPVAPFVPVAPLGPVAPVAPPGPLGPVAPVAPDAPAIPAEPAGPDPPLLLAVHTIEAPGAA